VHLLLAGNQNASIAGITKEDLLSLDPAKTFPDALDLVAEALLHSPQGYGGWHAGYGYNFEAIDRISLAPVVTALEQIYKDLGRFPETLCSASGSFPNMDRSVTEVCDAPHEYFRMK